MIFILTPLHFGTNIQERLLNKPYANEVPLQGKTHLENAATFMEFSHNLKKGLDLLMLKIWGL